MMDQNLYVYKQGLTNEEKCRMWLDLDLISEHEYNLLKAIMDEYNPQTVSDNKLVFLKLLYQVGEVTQEEYEQVLSNLKEQG